MQAHLSHQRSAVTFGQLVTTHAVGIYHNFHWRAPDLSNITGFFDLCALLDRPKDELALDLLVSFGDHRAIDEKLFQSEQVKSDILHRLTAAESRLVVVDRCSSRRLERTAAFPSLPRKAIRGHVGRVVANRLTGCHASRGEGDVGGGLRHDGNGVGQTGGGQGLLQVLDRERSGGPWWRKLHPSLGPFRAWPRTIPRPRDSWYYPCEDCLCHHPAAPGPLLVLLISTRLRLANHPTRVGPSCRVRLLRRPSHSNNRLGVIIRVYRYRRADR